MTAVSPSCSRFCGRCRRSHRLLAASILLILALAHVELRDVVADELLNALIHDRDPTRVRELC